MNKPCFRLAELFLAAAAGGVGLVLVILVNDIRARGRTRAKPRV